MRRTHWEAQVQAAAMGRMLAHVLGGTGRAQGGAEQRVSADALLGMMGQKIE